MDPSPINVQIVHKSSSDKLLQKFADAAPPKPEPRKLALHKRSRPSSLRARESFGGSPRSRRHSGGGLVSLLPPPRPSSARKSAVLRRLGIRRSEIGALEVAGVGLLFAALEKTWRKSVRGASKMFVERHRSGHVRLISDIV
ncbi:hypothetical protein QJS10_CPB15g00188 [Acorus calamus]|uniref:Uncharacterized protein n=1 Tax=Acorus calamus TaxID=4465 RepID=A0AAV9D907_ACOCL|nr:hypothetical protein QJS10_CPB15g00188 [Acorus calamus]